MPQNQSDHNTVTDGFAGEAEPELLRGSQIERYVVLELLGRGGMGVVYRAYDPQLDRSVALKLISTSERGPRENVATRTARLLREAKALAQLNHPHVVAVHDVGTVGEHVFTAMEFVAGKTLLEWREATQPSFQEVLEVMLAAGSGLAAAHKRGLVHRDFKPANVIVGEDGRVRVIDFGLARVEAAWRSRDTVAKPELGATDTRIDNLDTLDAADGSQEPLDPNRSDLLSSPLTRVGGVMGTPGYMAPEQFLGGRLDGRADQFSYCAVLYELFYAQRPFRGRSVRELLKEIRSGRLQPPPADTDVPQWLHGIVARGLSDEPEKRFASMEELLDELREDPEVEARQRRLARRRSVMAALLAIVATAVPAGIWYEFAVGRSALCNDGPTQVANVWNPETSGKVHDGLVATGVPYAEDTAERVVSSLGLYTDAWQRMFTEACRATSVSGNQSFEVMDARMICLSRRLIEIEALTDILSRADAKVVEKAAQAANSLSPIADCADVEALMRPRERIQPAPDEETAQKVETLRGTLVQVEILDRTGKYEEGAQLAGEALSQAEALGYLPVKAEALYWVGSLSEKLGDYEEAAQILEGAYKLAAACMDDATAADAAAKQALVVGNRLAKHEEGLAWATLAEALEYSPAVSDLTRGERLNSVGGVLYSQGEYDKALAYHAKALAIRERTHGPEHPYVASTLGNMGNVFSRQGAYDKALERYRKAHAIFKRTLGPKHPHVAQALTNMGIVFSSQGAYDEALEHYRKAKTVFESALGPEHPHVGSTLGDMGNVFSRQGAHDKALEYFSEAQAIFEKALGPQHPLVAETLVGMGNVFSRQGAYDKALEYFSEAQDIYEKTLGPQHANMACPLSGMGGVLVDQGRPQEALEPLERALVICEKKRCQPEEHGQAFFALARALVATNADRGRALKLAEQALAVFGKGLRAFKKELEEVKAWLQEHRPE